MKSLFTLIVLTALVAFGGAFLEKWEIPGLENFPTARSVQARLKAQPVSGDPLQEIGDRRMEQGNESARPPGYFATGVNSATSTRNQQLRNAGKEMGVE